ncbi:MAG: ADP-glyceromanno-heptose 6-epimerase [Chitinophagaceae bacterium]|nr:ADP-glyceromanno-heptose 6-epimerase [Chitinophagaceae bacterium]
MDAASTIVITGAAGFIGSCLTGFLNEKGFYNLILVDEFNRPDKVPNLEGKRFTEKVDRSQLFDWLNLRSSPVEFIFHIGARTDTTEFDYSIHEQLNVIYSQHVWNYCTLNKVPLVYASSAATYGAGEAGYNDDHEMIQNLKPLNAYGVSKNEFDKWVLKRIAAGAPGQPPFWAGLKFFNVYGPNEFHKGRMASVIFHSFNQIKASGKVKLFRSHRPDFNDGQQLRDFVYVKDVIKVCYWLMINKPLSAIYNLGTGKARSFEHLVKSTFAGLEREPVIEFIDMPEDIRDKYQYFTEAEMSKLKEAGYPDYFHSLEKGVEDYVRNYLAPAQYY